MLAQSAPPSAGPADEDSLAAMRKEWLTPVSSPVKAEANGNAESGGTDDPLAVADMAAGWSRGASSESSSVHMGGYTLAGLAASVLVCSCPRYA